MWLPGAVVRRPTLNGALGEEPPTSKQGHLPRSEVHAPQVPRQSRILTRHSQTEQASRFHLAPLA